MQTCVSSWQVVLFSFGSEVGHTAVRPLQKPVLAHSDSVLQLSLEPLKSHSVVQHGPWLGLGEKNITHMQSEVEKVRP